MLLDELLDVFGTKAGHFAKSHARQAGQFAGDVVIDPSLAYAEPRGYVRNGEKTFWLAELLPIRRGRRRNKGLISAPRGSEHVRLLVSITDTAASQVKIIRALLNADEFAAKFGAVPAQPQRGQGPRAAHLAINEIVHVRLRAAKLMCRLGDSEETLRVGRRRGRRPQCCGVPWKICSMPVHNAPFGSAAMAFTTTSNEAPARLSMRPVFIGSHGQINYEEIRRD
jgi:hypothetical protein